MTRAEIDQFAEDSGEELMFLDGHDNAIVGICRQFNNVSVLYNRNKVISNLMKDMSMEEAEEYFEYNIIGAWVGENTPSFIL